MACIRVFHATLTAWADLRAEVFRLDEAAVPSVVPNLTGITIDRDHADKAAGPFEVDSVVAVEGVRGTRLGSRLVGIQPRLRHALRLLGAHGRRPAGAEACSAHHSPHHPVAGVPHHARWFFHDVTGRLVDQYLEGSDAGRLLADRGVVVVAELHHLVDGEAAARV